MFFKQEGVILDTSKGNSCEMRCSSKQECVQSTWMPHWLYHFPCLMDQEIG